MTYRKGISFYDDKDRKREAQHGEVKTKLIRDTARRKSEREERKSRRKAPRTMHQQEH